MQLHYNWFVSVWNKAVEILGTCMSRSFFSPSFPFLTLILSPFPSPSLFLSLSYCKYIVSVPHGRDDGSLAAYHAFHQTTKKSKHVYTGSCAPLLNSILCGIRGDWHVLCLSEWVSSAQKCDSWAELFHSSHMRKTEMKHGQSERRDIESGVATASWLWLGAKQMLAHVLWVSADITVFESGLTH